MEDNYDIQEFDRQKKQEWIDAIAETFGETPPTSAMWDRPDAYLAVLSLFMVENLNHTMPPGGGGIDMVSIGDTHEPGCMEFYTSPRAAHVFCPEKLYFEFFDKSPWNSFFLMEVSALKPTGVNETADRYEEVLELSPGEYVDRSCLDEARLGYRESGEEIPLPEEHCLISRDLVDGKFLVVSKRSIWNLTNETYDGRHNKMTHDEIRRFIQARL